MQDSDPAIHPAAKREGRGRRHSDSHRPWQEVAPRWLLVTVIGILLAACGYLWGRAAAKESKEMETLRAAVEDSDNKADQRALERIAVAEEQIRQLTLAMQENTSQLRLLTAQIKRQQ